MFSYNNQVETLLKTQFTDLLENGTKNYETSNVRC
jgi:hypothetical protein